MRQLIVALLGLFWLACAAAGMRRGRKFWGARIVGPHSDDPARRKLRKQLELGLMFFMATVIALIAYALA